MSFSKFSTKQDKILVAAIDFGTTYSGYAYSFKEEFQRDPKNIFANTNWGGNAVLSQKTVTCALFDSDRKFHSFGYEAETEYTNLAAEEEHHGWFFFRRFKMQLHRKEIKRDMLLDADIPENKMKAMTVFAECIGYLKNHLLQSLKDQGTTTENKDIHWILTVPAIWSDPAKQFMRESAQKAGIAGDQLTIALEPEAASMYVQIACDGAMRAIEKPGTKFMVIDLGGGTADITMHEKGTDGAMHELHNPDGGNWGGTVVDEEFTSLLVSLVGADIFKKFCEEEKLDHLDLQREFEITKRTVEPSKSDTKRLKAPISLPDMYEKETAESISVGIKHSTYTGKLTCKKDKLMLKSDTIKALFKKSISSIIKMLNNLLMKQKVKDTTVFLLVGGFSESKIIQDEIRTALEKINKDAEVIIPKDAGLAVVKGAVLFGHQPIKIKSRIAKYTFGINISPMFSSDQHPEHHRVSVGGVDRCRDVFKKYIQAGEEVQVGEEKTGKHIALQAKQKEMLLKLYASPKPDPQFVDEPDAEYMGDLVVCLPESDEKIKVEVKMAFGDTELAVQAEEQATKKRYEAYFDFLR